MMSTEERQKNEFEVLQSMYGEDLKDLRGKSPWNQWTPLNLSITLIPQKGSSGTQEIHVQTDLHIVCTKDYPDSIPNIILENNKGLSNTLLTQLQDELNQEANSLKGEEMIFQMVQHVQEFLHRHNKPTSKSFYDEMLQRQKKKQQEELEAKELEQNREKQYIIEEVQKRHEYFRNESKKRRESRYTDNASDEGFEVNMRSSLKKNYSSESSDESLCMHAQTLVIDFNGRQIQRGKCLKHNSQNLVIFNGMDLDSGDIVQISEWTINLFNKNDLTAIQRQISSIEQEFSYLTKLKHLNIAQYQNIKCDFFSEENKFVIYVVQEFILGSNCNTLFVNQNIKVDIDLLKYISKGVLLAVDYLHRNNVVHKHLSDSCVYLGSKGIKVSKYSINKRLTDLTSQSPTNYGKKTDIYYYGLFLLTLIQGSPVDTENVEIPSSIPSDLYDLLQKCLVKEEKERYSTTQLLNHSFFRKTIVHFPPNHCLEEYAKEHDKPEAMQDDIEILGQYQSNGQSRINNEFEKIEHLGKGAFGDVIKVRNKLDGGYYAIKRIKLNPKNKHLNKKIVREVKLLSKLNHENVVRYYNSWIETTTIKNDDTDSTATISDIDVNIPKILRKDEFTLNDSNIEEMAPPPAKNIEVSITYDSKSQPAFNSDDDSSDDDWPLYQNDSDSDDIEFEHDFSESKVVSTSSISSDQLDSCQEHVKQIDFMYIQMEFCEKSTLRTAIDDNLYTDESRVWRLFREIIEGLAHIHQQGMIHRDLKPVNIFLDSEDHVKIGDFGLATTDIKSKSDYSSKSPIQSEKEVVADESKTGVVGTALYVAPEISMAVKAFYNQKVDIYSLGVIFFEMCYKPLKTSMERIKILTGLRSKEIEYPEDFLVKKNEKQQILLGLLLTHDTSKRPTSLELLQSEHIPPPVLEERELRELVRHTISNPHLKGYKYLMMSCFQQSVTPAQDITYDKDPSSSQMPKHLQLYDLVRQETIKIFKRHGGQNLSTPLLMPKSKFYENGDTYVKLMTHYGGIVSLPHDLRVPFARYIAWNGIQLFRRHSVERVYRERKLHGFLPRELFECAFDIVSPSPGNLMSDGEILYMVFEIINQLPVLKTKHFLIRLNHTSLLKAILIHCGIKEEKHCELYKILTDIKEGKASRNQMQDYLITLGLSDNSINTFMNLINSESEIGKITNQLQVITKKKSNESSQLAKQAIQDLKLIAQNAEAFGVTFEIIISPSLVYNIQQYSGMIFQFVCDIKKKHKHSSMEVVAAGGRYDSMIAYYRNIMLQANMLSKDIQQAAVGVSISLDKLVQAIQREESDFNNIHKLDVAVCSIGSKPMLKEKAKILNMLWSEGIRSCLIESTNQEDIHDEINELNIPHTVILKDTEQAVVRIQSWGKDRLQESVVPTSKLVKELLQTLKQWQDKNMESIPVFNVSRSDSKMFCNEETASTDVIFVTEEKLSSNARKRYDNQVRSHLESLFKKLAGPVIVLGVTLEINIIRTMSSFLEFENETCFEKSVSIIIEKHQRHKTYITDVSYEIYEHKTKRTNPTIVLFSIKDYFYKVII